MKIRSLQLKNIGVFEDETIAFPENKEKGKAEIHILTGQNGTGKTTILQALTSNMLMISPFSTYYHYNHNNRVKNNSEHNLSKKATSISESKTILNNQVEFNFLQRGISRYSEGMSKDYADDSNKTFEENITSYNEFRKKIGIDFCAFAYSGNRFIEHEENINIKEQEDYDPLENALAFDKEYGKDDYSINQWLANTISKRSFARDEGNEEKAKAFDRNIKFLEKIIQEIIEKSIKFEPVYETGIKIIANVEGKKLDFDLLPDGLRSIISWLGDLIMRMDAIKWENDLAINDREFILFLDEIEVHLHPYWQRKILPVIQKTFKNAQIFITTHSPFIVNSVDGAWIYELDLDEKTGNCKVTKVKESNTADSYQTVIREIFEVNRFSEPLVSELKSFTDMRNEILLKKQVDEKAFLEKATQLANKNDEIKNTILFELRQLSTKTGKEFVL